MNLLAAILFLPLKPSLTLPLPQCFLLSSFQILASLPLCFIFPLLPSLLRSFIALSVPFTFGRLSSILGCAYPRSSPTFNTFPLTSQTCRFFPEGLPPRHSASFIYPRYCRNLSLHLTTFSNTYNSPHCCSTYLH